jgi:transcription initiation factor TFIID subunit 11
MAKGTLATPTGCKPSSKVFGLVMLEPPHFNMSLPTPTPTANQRGRPRGATAAGGTPIGSKRGRKPRGVLPSTTISSPRPIAQYPGPSTSLPTSVHWASQPSTSSSIPSNTVATATPTPAPATTAATLTTTTFGSQGPLASFLSARSQTNGSTASDLTASALMGLPPVAASVLQNSGSVAALRPVAAAAAAAAVDEDADGDDELLPAMADDDYSAQLSWQSQSKDNLRFVLIFRSPCVHQLCYLNLGSL